jgi:hypothetical protein
METPGIFLAAKNPSKPLKKLEKKRLINPKLFSDSSQNKQLFFEPSHHNHKISSHSII